MSASFDLAGAIRGEAERIARDISSGHLATVISNDPMLLELLESRHVLHDDEVSMTQWVRRYHREDVIDPGDVVVLLRKKRNGEDIWVISDVIADKDPT